MVGTPLSVAIVGPETRLGWAVFRRLDPDPRYLPCPVWTRQADFLDNEARMETLARIAPHAIINCSLRLDPKTPESEMYAHNVLVAGALAEFTRTHNALFVQAGTVLADNPVTPAAASAAMADRQIQIRRRLQTPAFTVRLPEIIEVDDAADALVRCLQEREAGVFYVGANGKLVASNPEIAHV